MKKIEKMENSDLINSFKKITKFLIIARFQIYIFPKFDFIPEGIWNFRILGIIH